jgi:hypothetical protein
MLEIDLIKEHVKLQDFFLIPFKSFIVTIPFPYILCVVLSHGNTI